MASDLRTMRQTAVVLAELSGDDRDMLDMGASRGFTCAAFVRGREHPWVVLCVARDPAALPRRGGPERVCHGWWDSVAGVWVVQHRRGTGDTA